MMSFSLNWVLLIYSPEIFAAVRAQSRNPMHDAETGRSGIVLHISDVLDSLPAIRQSRGRGQELCSS